jgi:hypothetical protein
MAAYVAYAGDDGIERSADEVEKAASALQKAHGARVCEPG